MLFNPRSLENRNKSLIKRAAAVLEVEDENLNPYPSIVIIKKSSVLPNYHASARYDHFSQQITLAQRGIIELAHGKNLESFLVETLIHENAHFIHHSLLGEVYVKMWPPSSVNLKQVGIKTAKDYTTSYKWLEGLAFRVTQETLNNDPPTLLDVEKALQSRNLAFYFHFAGWWQVSQLEKAHFIRLSRLSYCDIDRISPLPSKLDIFRRNR